MNWFIDVLLFCNGLWDGSMPGYYDYQDRCKVRVDKCMLSRSIGVRPGIPEHEEWMLAIPSWESWLKDCMREEWDRKF